DDIRLQSRGGKPMNRYFPDVVEQVAGLSEQRLVLDGEMIVVRDGIQEFDLLSQRIHPAQSRVEMLAKETPAEFVAFDLLAHDDDGGQLHVVGHTSSFKARERRELIDFLEPYRTHERGSGGPSRWKADEDLQWEGLRPELVCEVAFDHITGNRIRHGAKF